MKHDLYVIGYRNPAYHPMMMYQHYFGVVYYARTFIGRHRAEY